MKYSVLFSSFCLALVVSVSSQATPSITVNCKSYSSSGLDSYRVDMVTATGGSTSCFSKGIGGGTVYVDTPMTVTFKILKTKNGKRARVRTGKNKYNTVKTCTFSERDQASSYELSLEGSSDNPNVLLTSKYTQSGAVHTMHLCP